MCNKPWVLCEKYLTAEIMLFWIDLNSDLTNRYGDQVVYKKPQKWSCEKYLRLSIIKEETHMNSEQLTQHAIEPSSDSAETVGEKWNLSSSTMLSPEEINELKRKTKEKVEYLQKYFPSLKVHSSEE